MRKVIAGLTLSSLIIGFTINSNVKAQDIEVWKGKLNLRTYDLNIDGKPEAVEIDVHSREGVYLGTLIDAGSEYPNYGPNGDEIIMDQFGEPTSLYKGADGKIETHRNLMLPLSIVEELKMIEKVQRNYELYQREYETKFNSKKKKLKQY